MQTKRNNETTITVYFEGDRTYQCEVLPSEFIDLTLARAYRDYVPTSKKNLSQLEQLDSLLLLEFPDCFSIRFEKDLMYRGSTFRDCMNGADHPPLTFDVSERYNANFNKSSLVERLADTKKLLKQEDLECVIKELQWEWPERQKDYLLDLKRYGFIELFYATYQEAELTQELFEKLIQSENLEKTSIKI